MRVNFIKSAWQIFLENPLFGGALENPAFRIYPHNIIVEAFMATGIFGGTLLILACAWGLTRAFLSAVLFPDSALFGVLFVQYFVASQFSGAIWGAIPFWATFGCVIAVTGNRFKSLRHSSRSVQSAQVVLVSRATQ